MAAKSQHIPGMAWLCVICGAIINFNLICLYAFSIWRAELHKLKMIPNEGMTFIYILFCILFASVAILGGWLTDRIGPRITAMIGGAVMMLGLLFVGAALNAAPFWVMLAGFGIIASLGMGLAFSATVPGALKWFGSRWAGLVAGLVVCPYGFAALFVAPLVKSLVSSPLLGLRGSFIFLGMSCGLVVIAAGVGLVQPRPGYAPPVSARGERTRDWGVGEALSSARFYLTLFLFLIGVTVGLTFVGQMVGVMYRNIGGMSGAIFLLPILGGLLNGSSRVVAGVISDFTGRHWPLIILYAGAALSAFLVAIMLLVAKSSLNLILMFFIFSGSYLFYGSLFSLIPAMAVDYFGTRNLGTIYGLIFFGGFGLGSWVIQMIIGLADLMGPSKHVFMFTMVGFLALGGVGLAIISLVLDKRRAPEFQAEAAPAAYGGFFPGDRTFCQDCGASNPPEAIFCQGCGNKLRTS